MRYLAIDHGVKRTGIAICDASETIVTPLVVIRSQKDLLKKITDIVRRQEAQAVVVGLPFNMNGSEGSQAKIVLKFAKQLKEYFDIPIYFQDERLSSFDAEQRLASAELTRGKKKKRLDAVAAVSILEAFLEQK